MTGSDEETKRKIFKFAFFSACVVLLIIILWSVVTDTLLPLYRSKEYGELIYNIIGIPLILIGTGIFVYGGWVFYRDTRNIFDNPRLTNNIDIIREKTASNEKIKTARSENTRMLFSTWKKGAFWLLIGALLITAGGIIINMKKLIG
jgi:hypothetical protein